MFWVYCSNFLQEARECNTFRVPEYSQYDFSRRGFGFEFLWFWWLFMVVFHRTSSVLRIIGMDPSFITCHYPPRKSLIFLFKMTQKFPWNSDTYVIHLLSQFSWYPPGTKFQNPKRLIMWSTLSLEIPNLWAMSFCLSWWLSKIVSSKHSSWGLSVAVIGLPNIALSKKLASTNSSCLNCYTKGPTVLISTHLSPYTACIWQWMLMGGTFSTFKNSIMAFCLNCMSSQPSISTGTEPQLWIAVGSRLQIWREDITWLREFDFIQFSLLQ